MSTQRDCILSIERLCTVLCLRLYCVHTEGLYFVYRETVLCLRLYCVHTEGLCFVYRETVLCLRLYCVLCLTQRDCILSIERLCCV